MPFCTINNFEVAPGVYTHDYTVQEVEEAEGCCQKFVCGIPCPKQFDKSGVALGFGLPVALVSLSWVVMGFVIAWLTIKRDDYRGFFVCNRTLPLYIVTFALLGQGLDSSSALGNPTNIYKYSFWDGAVPPIGVGLSLILNGFLLAAPINRMGLLTLPDLFGRKYGTLMEVMVSLVEIASFTVLLAGNLVGISLVLQFCFGLTRGAGVAIAGLALAIYTASGGLYSVALTDIPQVIGGLSGLLVVGIYILVTEGGDVVPPPSLGFAVDLGPNVTVSTPGYAGPASCKDPVTGSRTCDNYAYPVGDKILYANGMTDADAYAPYPNAILYNWSGTFVLAFGNLCALDFQARCIAAKCPRTARTASFVAGLLLLVLSLPFGIVLGSLARKYFGPDSPYAVYEPDTCSAPLSRPSCAKWVPQEQEALFAALWGQVPRALGAWALIAIVTAAVSTADGAILATSTVAAHNIWRKVPRIGANERNMLWVSRAFIAPMTGLACCVAAVAYRPSYLVVVSFDIVFASVFVPLMAAVYWPSVSPNAGILSCLGGSLLRITLEQVLPKDGSLTAPLGQYSLAYGKAVPGLPSFVTVDPPELTEAAGVWDPQKTTCEQVPLADWTGLDSILSPAFSLVVMVAVSLVERRWPGVDLLWFVPKTWRLPSPLYVLDDPPERSSVAKLEPQAKPAEVRRRKPRFVMPSVPEEEYYETYDRGDFEGEGEGGGGGAAAAAIRPGIAASAAAGGAGTRTLVQENAAAAAAAAAASAAGVSGGEDEGAAHGGVLEEGDPSAAVLADTVLRSGGSEDIGRHRSRSRSRSRSRGNHAISGQLQQLQQQQQQEWSLRLPHVAVAITSGSTLPLGRGGSGTSHDGSADNDRDRDGGGGGGGGSGEGSSSSSSGTDFPVALRSALDRGRFGVRRTESGAGGASSGGGRHPRHPGRGRDALGPLLRGGRPSDFGSLVAEHVIAEGLWSDFRWVSGERAYERASVGAGPGLRTAASVGTRMRSPARSEAGIHPEAGLPMTMAMPVARKSVATERLGFLSGLRPGWLQSAWQSAPGTARSARSGAAPIVAANGSNAGTAGMARVTTRWAAAGVRAAAALLSAGRSSTAGASEGLERLAGPADDSSAANDSRRATVTAIVSAAAVEVQPREPGDLMRSSSL